MVGIIAVVIIATILMVTLRPVYTARDAMADRRAKRYFDDNKHFR